MLAGYMMIGLSKASYASDIALLAG
jgi:hypothetical protein